MAGGDWYIWVAEVEKKIVSHLLEVKGSELRFTLQLKSGQKKRKLNFLSFGQVLTALSFIPGTVFSHPKKPWKNIGNSSMQNAKNNYWQQTYVLV